MTAWRALIIRCQANERFVRIIAEFGEHVASFLRQDKIDLWKDQEARVFGAVFVFCTGLLVSYKSHSDLSYVTTGRDEILADHCWNTF